MGIFSIETRQAFSGSSKNVVGCPPSAAVRALHRAFGAEVGRTVHADQVLEVGGLVDDRDRDRQFLRFRVCLCGGRDRLGVGEGETQLGTHSGLLLVVLSGEVQTAAKDPGEGSGKCAGIVAGDP